MYDTFFELFNAVGLREFKRIARDMKQAFWIGFLWWITVFYYIRIDWWEDASYPSGSATDHLH